MAQVEAESSWEKYGAFPNSIDLKAKGLIERLEEIKERIGRLTVTVLFDQTC